MVTAEIYFETVMDKSNLNYKMAVTCIDYLVQIGSIPTGVKHFMSMDI